VARADYTRNLGGLVECPLYKNKSIHKRNRIKKLKEIDRENTILLNKLESSVPTIKNSKLEEQWR
jgi:hypothetical protein